jgi:hypothetical protein
MASMSDYVLDAALSKLDTEADKLYITSQEATTYTEATSTYALGSATSISIGAPQDRMVNSVANGREVVLANVTGGNVSATGDADTFALVDSTNSRLLATGGLTGGGQTVTLGNTFVLASIAIGIPDPA